MGTRNQEYQTSFEKLKCLTTNSPNAGHKIICDTVGRVKQPRARYCCRGHRDLCCLVYLSTGRLLDRKVNFAITEKQAPGIMFALHQLPNT
ncbi:hypothetical protein RRG08_015055 [Elysia crispata]|uniref:Uncharacterized protein n=1 Tax=Elysia crispata TaxID=231223 RepID=A0AAE1B5X3_9GAST|nr:hypothetical protein RRG08_015055 [Elysia crispata]